MKDQNVSHLREYLKRSSKTKMCHLKRVPEAAAPRPKCVALKESTWSSSSTNYSTNQRRPGNRFCKLKSNLPFILQHKIYTISSTICTTLQSFSSLFPCTATFKITRTIYHRKTKKSKKSRHKPKNLPSQTYNLPYCNNFTRMSVYQLWILQGHVYRNLHPLYLPSLKFDSLGSTFRRL